MVKYFEQKKVLSGVGMVKCLALIQRCCHRWWSKDGSCMWMFFYGRDIFRKYSIRAGVLMGNSGMQTLKGVEGFGGKEARTSLRNHTVQAGDDSSKTITAILGGMSDF